MMGFADVPMEIFKSTRKSTDGSKNAAGGKKPAPGENKQDTASVKEGRTSSDGNSLKAPSTLDDGSSVHQSVGGESGKDQTASITDQSTQSGPSDPPKSPGLQPGKASDTERKRTPSPARDITMGTAIGAGKGFGRMVDAGLKSPMDFTLSLARGFHNAPKLYGDKSVRPSERITGFQSGLRAAGKVSGSNTL